MEDPPRNPGPPPSARPGPTPSPVPASAPVPATPETSDPASSPAPISARPEGEPPGEASTGSKPTPVRVATGGSPAVPDAPPPSREFEVDGVPWVAVTAGSTLSGAAGDAATILILVVFHRDGAVAPEKERLVSRRALDELSELELLEVFESAVPFRGHTAPSEVFTETRRPGGNRH